MDTFGYFLHCMGSWRAGVLKSSQLHWELQNPTGTEKQLHPIEEIMQDIRISQTSWNCKWLYQTIWMFPKIGGKTPKWMVFIYGKPLWTNGWFGGGLPPLFLETSIYGSVLGGAPPPPPPTYGTPPPCGVGGGGGAGGGSTSSNHNSSTT